MKTKLPRVHVKHTRNNQIEITHSNNGYQSHTLSNVTEDDAHQLIKELQQTLTVLAKRKNYTLIATHQPKQRKYSYVVYLLLSDRTISAIDSNHIQLKGTTIEQEQQIRQIEQDLKNKYNIISHTNL